jgi:integrase/recombinase XerD
MAGRDGMSQLRTALDDYLWIRRALGFKLERAGRLLPQFVAYLERSGTRTITTELALAWAKQPADSQPEWWAHRMSEVRGFARHLHALDPRTEVPPVDLLPRQVCRATPYLYTEADVAALMQGARALHPPLRAATYETLVGLLAVTGMRVGEAIRLDRDDLDWMSGLLTVRDTKFGKSRLVPHGPRVGQLVWDQLARRLGGRSADDVALEPLFTFDGRRSIHPCTASQVFHQLVIDLDLTIPDGVSRPRLHDYADLRVMPTWHLPELVWR